MLAALLLVAVNQQRRSENPDAEDTLAGRCTEVAELLGEDHLLDLAWPRVPRTLSATPGAIQPRAASLRLNSWANSQSSSPISEPGPGQSGGSASRRNARSSLRERCFLRREVKIHRIAQYTEGYGHSLDTRIGRPLRDLRISVTDRCNFRCTYCMPREVFGPGFQFLRHDEVLSFEEIARLARIAVPLGVRKLRLTGGEPLVRRDLELLIAMLSQIPGRGRLDADDQRLASSGEGRGR